MNPFIIDFFKRLMKESGEEIPEDLKAPRFEDLFTLFERVLGQNVLSSLPPDRQQQYMTEYEKDRSIPLARVGEVLGEGFGDPQAIMKKTLTDFADLYHKNRERKKTV